MTVLSVRTSKRTGKPYVSGWLGKARQTSLLSVGEQIDGRSAGGRMVLNLLATVSQLEREVIGERTKAALQHLKRQGRRVGAVPYGWRLVDGIGKQLEQDPAEQLVIAQARNSRRPGIPCARSAPSSTARGYRSRTGHRSRRRKSCGCARHEEEAGRRDPDRRARGSSTRSPASIPRHSTRHRLPTTPAALAAALGDAPDFDRITQELWDQVLRPLPDEPDFGKLADELYQQSGIGPLYEEMAKGIDEMTERVLGPRMGRPPSDDPHLTLTVRAPRSLLRQLDEARGKRGRGDVVREALVRWLKAVKRQPRAVGAIVIALGMSSASAKGTEFCQDKWPGDFSMQNWCIKQQNAAIDEIMEFREKYNISRKYSAAQIHEKADSGDVAAQILLHCDP